MCKYWFIYSTKFLINNHNYKLHLDSVSLSVVFPVIYHLLSWAVVDSSDWHIYCYSICTGVWKACHAWSNHIQSHSQVYLCTWWVQWPHVELIEQDISQFCTNHFPPSSHFLQQEVEQRIHVIRFFRLGDVICLHDAGQQGSASRRKHFILEGIWSKQLPPQSR